VNAGPEATFLHALSHGATEAMLAESGAPIACRSDLVGSQRVERGSSAAAATSSSTSGTSEDS
jgi:hypothetical protein